MSASRITIVRRLPPVPPVVSNRAIAHHCFSISVAGAHLPISGCSLIGQNTIREASGPRAAVDVAIDRVWKFIDGVR